MATTLIVYLTIAAMLLVFGLLTRRRRLAAATPRPAIPAAPAPPASEAWLPIARIQTRPPVRIASGGVRVLVRRDPGGHGAAAAVDGRIVGHLPERVAGAYLARLGDGVNELGAAGLAVSGRLTIVPSGLVEPPGVQYLHPTRAWGWRTKAARLERGFVHVPGVLSLFRRAEQPVTDAGTELDAVPALLVLTPDGFVDVFARDTWLGALARSDAAPLRPGLEALRRTGGVLQVDATIGARLEHGVPQGKVSVQLPPADQVLPPGPLPDAPFVVLPAVTTLQVIGEDAHTDRLAPLLGGTSETLAVATLHTGPAEGDPVEVRIAGEPIGRLSPTGTSACVDLVRACERVGKLPVVRALLSGNSLLVSAAVRTARTADVTDDWLRNELGH